MPLHLGGFAGGLNRVVLVVPLLALVAMVATERPASSAAIECAESERFTIRVLRVSRGPVDGMEVQVEAQGYQGTDSVKSGLIRICVHGGRPGAIVRVHLGGRASRAFRLLYPPNAEVVMTHESSPSIVVCKVRECETVTLGDIDELFDLVRKLAAGRSPEGRATLPAEWLRWLRGQGIEAGPLVAALADKERQTAVARGRAAPR